MKRICVYCGSKPGIGEHYLNAATELAKALVKRDIELVYGGATVGLMGKVADTMLQHGGKVTGVIPQGLFKEGVAHSELSRQIFVADMHERKATMMQLSDGFIAIPGGYGTMEEVLETITWRQLEIHKKPIGLLNTDQFYDSLIAFISHSHKEGFIKQRHLDLFIHHTSANSLVESLCALT